MLFYEHLDLLPGGGRLDDWLEPPAHVTGFYLIDSLLAGDHEAFWNALQHLILPSFTLSFVHLSIVARQIRSAMLEQLSEDYIRTARASGLTPWRIVVCHALPNALIPSVTVLGLALGDLLYGAVLTETVFSWPGMGAYVVASIQALDFPAVMGFAVVAIAAVIGSLLSCFSGVLGGFSDAVIMRVMEIMLSIPSLVLTMALAAALGPSLFNAMLAIAIVRIPFYVRLARGQTLVVSQFAYVQAAKTFGANRWHLITWHILRNALPPLVVQTSLDIGAAILMRSLWVLSDWVRSNRRRSGA